MSNEGKPGARLHGSDACRDMSSSVLDDYNEKLIAMVTNSQAGITVSDIRNFLDTYKEQQKTAATPAHAAQYQKCQVLQEQEMFDGSRREPFRRILVMRISRLFPPEGKMIKGCEYISRRALPGLFSVIDKMTGAEGGGAGRQVCLDEIQRLKNEGGGKFLWEDLYKTPAVRKAVDDLLMAMVPHFENIHKRVLWMRTIINSELAPAIDYDFEGPASMDWELDERGTFILLRELFGEFRPMLKDKENAAKLINNYGKEQVQGLLAVIKSLDAAEV